MSLKFGVEVDLNWIFRYCQYTAAIKTNYVKGTNGSNKMMTDNQLFI